MWWGREYNIKRQVTKQRPNSEGRKSFPGPYALRASLSSCQLSHPVKASTSFPLLFAAAFHKELDDGCVCWEDHGLFSLFVSILEL